MSNTLHGFNSLTDDGTLIIGTLEEEKGLKEGLKVLISKLVPDANDKLDLAYIDSSYAGDCLHVHSKIYQHIPAIIDFVRKWTWIKLQTRLCVVYKKIEEGKPYVPFSVENSEKLIIPYIRREEDNVYLYGNPDLWCTPEGKKLARELQDKFPRQEIVKFEPKDGVDGIDFPIKKIS